MRESPSRTRHGETAERALFVTFAAVLALASGCDHIFDYPRRTASSMQCSATVQVARAAPLTCSDYIRVASQHRYSPELAWFDNNDPSQIPKLYVGPYGYVPAAGGIPDIVKGTCLVRLPYEDGTSQADPYLTLSFTDPIDTVYIGFDRRARIPPQWLTDKFKPVADFAVISTEKPSPDSPRHVEYQIYEPKAPTDFMNGAALGGNDLGTVWTGSKPGSQYLVFVKNTEISPAIAESFAITVEACATDATPEAAYATVRDREQSILSEWAEKNGRKAAFDAKLLSLSFQAGNCQSVTKSAEIKACPKADEITSTSSGLVVNAWPRMSTAYIDDTLSTATIHVQDEVRKVQIGGPISFAITEAAALNVDELSLFVTSPLTVRGLKIEKVSLGQRGSISASCLDRPLPGPYGLCHDYAVPATTTAFAALTATVEQETAFTPLVNNQPIPISVDHNNKIFKMSGGGINGRLNTSDGPVDAQIELDLTGKFDNFAPVASAKESRTRFPCTDHNQGHVTLDASASYDRDQAASTLRYRWVEDAGTPVPRLLGKQKRITNLPMNFGGHNITLSVEDSRGTVGTLALQVEVYDSKIDNIKAPKDVFAIFNRRGTRIALKAPAAVDACSGQVLVHKNSPARTTFPRGLTPVEWVFDDYRGNVVVRRQNVFVVPAALYPPPIATGSASLASVPGSGLTLTYVYGTLSQGKAVVADRYILIETPRREVYTFGAANRLSRPNEIVPHALAANFGGNTSASLTLPAWDKMFPQAGRYALVHFLVMPGGDPKDSRSIIAYHRCELNR